MRPARFILAFTFIVGCLALAVSFRGFLHSHKPAEVSAFCAFLFVTNRWDRWFRRLRPTDDLTTLDLNSRVDHG